MAKLTPLDEKLAEVLGLAQAAQDATTTVAKLADDDAIEAPARPDVPRTRRRPSSGRSRSSTASRARRREIREKGPETKARGDRDDEGPISRDDPDELDGFEFLTMAEAGELGHWEIVREISTRKGGGDALELAEWAVPDPAASHRDPRARVLARAGGRGGRRRWLLGDHGLDAEHDAHREQRERGDREQAE